jgi:hypothetical protein
LDTAETPATAVGMAAADPDVFGLQGSIQAATRGPRRTVALRDVSRESAAAFLHLT